MKTRTSARAAALTVAGACILGAVGCDQPLPKCNVYTDFANGGKFGARYTLVEGSKTGDGDCDQLHGEVLHFGSYYASKDDKSPNYNKVSVAIEPDSHSAYNINLANAQGWGFASDIPPADEDQKPYAWGGFDQAEPSNDICTVNDFEYPARLDRPTVPAWEIDDGTGVYPQAEYPAVDTTYEFSNLKVYMTPENPGRQVAIDLTFTSGGCTAEYKVKAIFPATYCNVDSTDEDGNPIVVASDEVCQTTEAFKDDDVECDPNTFLCVPKGDIPSLR